MRYFIYTTIEITEVDANSYEFWHELNSVNFKLPDFEITVEETVYSRERLLLRLGNFWITILYNCKYHSHAIEK